MRAQEPSNPRGTILFIHGLGESGLCFEHLLNRPELSDWRLLIPDLPGYGLTPLIDEAPLSLIEHADWLAGWLRRNDAVPAVILGHSQGGVLALLMAERHPEVVASVIDVDGNKSLDDCVFSGRAMKWDRQAFLDGGFDKLRELVRRRGLKYRAQAGYHTSLLMADAATYHQNSSELQEMSIREDMAARLAALDVPAVYIAGVPDGASARSHELLAAAGVESIGIEPSGHWPFIDQTDDFCASVQRCLNA